MIKTNRLTFRIEGLEDANSIYEYLTDPEARKFTGGVTKMTLEELKETIIKNTTKFTLDPDSISNGDGICNFGVIENTTNEYAGHCGLKYCKPMKEVELFYGFRKFFWGTGIGTEAAMTVLKFGFDKIGLPAIYAAADPENITSEKILVKIGMKYLKPVQWIDGKYLKMFGISKKEFNGLKEITI